VGIVRFLRAKNSEADENRARNAQIQASMPAHPKPSPQEERIPLITRISPTEENPNSPPVYASTLRPRPFGSLSGKRRIPRLAATSSGTPFLRLSKPQPLGLSRMLLWKTRRQRMRIEAAVALNEDALPLAQDEDMWEDLIAERARAEQRTVETNGRYARAVHDGSEEITRLLVRERADNIARAAAMMRIIEQETALALEERRAKRGRQGTAD